MIYLYKESHLFLGVYSFLCSYRAISSPSVHTVNFALNPWRQKWLLRVGVAHTPARASVATVKFATHPTPAEIRRDRKLRPASQPFHP